MNLNGRSVFDRQDGSVRKMRFQAGSGPAGEWLRAVAVAMLTLAASAPNGFAQQTAPAATDSAASALPAAPAPI